MPIGHACTAGTTEPEELSVSYVPTLHDPILPKPNMPTLQGTVETILRGENPPWTYLDIEGIIHIPKEAVNPCQLHKPEIEIKLPWVLTTATVRETHDEYIVELEIPTLNH